ncbi:MAG: phosphate ABC transporter permease PstA [Anaerolineales bacterium]|nr:phosphate ABC transporter permease PstA [Anaerolineales bacterium]MCB8953245.1 phosphate ABC transporter permease PstA [Ardenticatenales bacterium]
MSDYPEGTRLTALVKRRHQVGTIWRFLFLGATIVGIITLVTLIFNIINDSFGLVAVQNQITPDSLVLAIKEDNILHAAHTVASEDDNELVAGIQSDPNAIGFFGYAYYRQNQNTLRVLSIDGVTPSADSAESGAYPLARPLYLYTSEEALRTNPQVAAFINYVLTHVNEEIDDVGYFPASNTALQEARAAWLQASGLAGEALPPVDAAAVEGDLVIAGSSTIYPLAQRLLNRFHADGYQGQATLDSIGSTAGLRRLCVEGSADIANASRPINQAEFEACRDNNRTPLQIRIGTDALAVVVSTQNTFANDVDSAQLRHIFTDAATWSDAAPAWPTTPIDRYVPGADSGTLDFFAETLFLDELADLSADELVGILAANISNGLGRRLERDQRFFADRLVFEKEDVFAEVCRRAEPAAACNLPPRTQQNIYSLVLERVVQPQVQQTWSLSDSILRRSQVLAQAQRNYPNAELTFRSWLTPQFLTNPQSSEAEFAGVRTAVLGSLWTILITILFSFPIGVGAAVYLEEYARDTFINRLIKTNINNLAGVPSIIYGMLGLAIFVRVLEPISSGAAFGLVGDTTTANGRTILSAGLTLGLLILPIIIISAQEAIRAVPNSLRQASLGLGATKWQTVWHHVLPNAFSGILTGTILAMSRAIGETAPLVVVGASTFITVDPSGPFSKFTTLPIQIYQWTSRPQDEFRNIAAAAIIVLLVMLIALNASAIFLRNRYSRRTR